MSMQRVYSMFVDSKYEDGPFFAKVSRAQLNEAEYAAPMVAALFFCMYLGNDDYAKEAATLAAVGQVGYFSVRVFADVEVMGMPLFMMFAAMRYFCFLVAANAAYIKYF